ncbi:MAG: acyl-CoA dehydratase activase-related protein [Syntrophales bacterium]|jgi:predicted CoA-substrate-specific enzyme activase|nr:acyl-CoA dehydratase activase-related protein [Syntrophales bacterium]MCK9528236.1 acyl-CoA dehydratase activase-related protein [Syntrophales bacterium]MDX9922367.1 acyl-CoA dehydratase activase-related protein [Syntrophales bacterium]
MREHQLRAGVDLGSTTAKLLVIDDSEKILFSSYRRHNAHIIETLAAILEDSEESIGNRPLTLSFTGSAGMGVADGLGAQFIQEVVAAGEVTRRHFPDTRVLIDIGGEDSKMIFFPPDRAPDIRMNGSCAGGTGAFIDQMATLLNLSINELDELSSRHNRIHPVASRCGVFAKTDIQNLVSRKIDLPDICASILQAVTYQNLNSLARGTTIHPKVLLCGGPLIFLAGLRESLRTALGMPEKDFIIPEAGLFFPAWGTALTSGQGSPAATPREWRRMIEPLSGASGARQDRLPPLFSDERAYELWERDRQVMNIADVDPHEAEPPFFIGIDSGSTTSKIMVIDSRERCVFSDYRPNQGSPVDAVKNALEEFVDYAGRHMKDVSLAAGKATGYGEDLIGAAFDLDQGVVETMAHWRAAEKCDPRVSFVLDIGGQDMKALFIRDQAIDRIEINEACSSGCGSFIEGFAQSLGLTAESFARRACDSRAPCDLGTRCTVFMNSRIKQAQRENAPIEDIAAGLAYGVIKNTLYKVLKLREPSELGKNVVVQGGTFKNPAVRKALELLTGSSVSSSDRPEMMGAYGAALLAKEVWETDPSATRMVKLDSLDRRGEFRTREVRCKGCTNQCVVTIYSFSGGRNFYTGNKCERYFGNRGGGKTRGTNLFSKRNEFLFNDIPQAVEPALNVTVGIPRILDMYENFPFWSTLLTECGFDVVPSSESSQEIYEKGLGAIMADNICFPAKLAHGHVVDLVEKGVDRVLYPLTFHESPEDVGVVNSYNCPIVASYAEVLKAPLERPGDGTPIFDAPPVSFRDEKLLKKGCRSYLQSLGISRGRFNQAFAQALAAQQRFRNALESSGKELLEQAADEGRPVVILAGRPYHADPLIEHQTSEMLADLGASVIPCEVASGLCETSINEFTVIPQWTFPNRLIKAARWVADQPSNSIQYVMLNSFGCGPDAFIMDEIRDILSEKGKPLTAIKIDEISSTGSARLRLRSLMETMERRASHLPERKDITRKTPPYLEKDRKKRIIGPYFADCYSPFFRPVFRLTGYDLNILPPPDKESVEYGMKYANNEICYPAIVVIGDIVKAFKSGLYDPETTVVGMSQTGGQCRATNYVPLIKKALIGAGYQNVPVIAAAHSKALANEQPGFNMAVHRIIRPAFASLLYADAIARMYYRTAVRERVPGQAETIRDHYLQAALPAVETDNTQGLLNHLEDAVTSFNEAIASEAPLPRIGIVGEIFLKYNSFSHMHVVDWMMAQNIEVSVPPLTDFVMQFFVNAAEKQRRFLDRRAALSRMISAFLEYYAGRMVERFEDILMGFRCYEPVASIYQKARMAEDIVSLSNQFGEGWLIPGEIAGFAREGIWNVVCLQPFGCIANQIVAKGIESRILQRYPMMNMLFLDFDAGTSEVNVLNRLHFMIENARRQVDRSRHLAQG